MPLAKLILNKGEERRLRAGHVWVFSNEVNTLASPLAAFEPGQEVSVVSHGGTPLGSAYVNPNTLICARLYSRRSDRPLNADLIQQRLKCALRARENWFPGHGCYRLVYGESDGLPGLIIDRYGDVCVVQINTAGMEQKREAVIAALGHSVHPRVVVLKNDNASRALEGLPSYCSAVGSEAPDTVTVQENGCEFTVPIIEGQKTGWYYDHRLNRARMLSYVKGQRVLDVFSYIGAWSVQAARFGALEVTAIDASSRALQLLEENATRNSIGGQLRLLHGDAFDTMKNLQTAGNKFDCVILDPPAFIKRKKDIVAGTQAYQQLNQMALQLLNDEGLLISASCSYHLGESELLDVLRRSAVKLNRELQILEPGQQAPDHPRHPAIPEMHYLKAYFCRSLARW